MFWEYREQQCPNDPKTNSGHRYAMIAAEIISDRSKKRLLGGLSLQEKANRGIFLMIGMVIEGFSLKNQNVWSQRLIAHWHYEGDRLEKP